MGTPGGPNYSLAASQQSPHSATFSHPGSDFRDAQDGGDNWSGDESFHEDEDGGGKKRKRPMSVSCDRGQPTCGWCAKNGQLCEYKERKKPGLRAGYGRELEARLDRLENILQSQQVAIAQLTQGLSPQTTTTSPPDANVFSHPLGVPQSDQDQNGGSIGFEQRQTPFGGQQTGVSDFRSNVGGAFNGFPQPGPPPSEKGEHPMIQPNLQAFYPNNNVPIKSPSIGQPEAQQPPPSLGQDHDLPPYDLLYSLADLYFKHINTWCPILHRRTTLDSLFGTSSADAADRALLHAIVATTMRFSTDPRLSDEKKKRYHATSKQKVLLYGLENSSVKALQALVILALDLCGEAHGPPGWNILALITRSAVQLGLSVEATSQLVSPHIPSIYTLRAMVLPEPTSWIEDESRRRLFWMVYVLDRYETVTTAFEFAMDEREIDRKLPCRDDMFARNQAVETRWFRAELRPEKGVDKPENLGSFSFYVEIVGVLSRIHQFLKKPVDISVLEGVERWQTEYRQLDAALNSWKQGLPKEYSNMNRLSDTSAGNNKHVNCGWVMLLATFFTTTIRLHSSAAYPTNRSKYFAPSYAASQRCGSSVEQMLLLCSHVNSAGLLNKLGPTFAFSVWVAARLMLVHSATVAHEINPEIGVFVDVLGEMGKYWNVAARYASVLQRVLDEFAESERNPSTNAEGERVTPTSVRILADMRRCAYDLDFLISRQPKQQTTPGGMAVVTPSRTPAPNELEYLDVFDFFNMPRLPVPMMDGTAGAGGGNGSQGIGGQGFSMGGVVGSEGVMTNEYNDSNLMYDPNVDWLR